ncbi:UDP-2,4-diacetamido-2,4,6-trideoxy-beta-L-altropyranose hydrolase [Aliagarivorans taiwanensis]|uniref:UDP-2,4-diacetamido-2,4, 6-trideoxy-beta-L-altropyranose hydrolase n=1 Tax=Aliagarivorans taiwanensis TaxID=561966 RepID=UPI00040D7306|nr:UDP-2,4-diacetamido-2,4,6-trideoxy-beta-L-altropyranose hydrolase [Aliagarivorans taiwanensis]
MRVAFRCDASAVIGTGHVMRCLNLADSMRAIGWQVSFLFCDHGEELDHLIRARNYPLHRLPSPSGEVSPEDTHSWLGRASTDDAQLCKQALPSTVDWLIVDHYAIDSAWHKEMRSHCVNLAVIDDLANRQYDCDVLVDQGLSRQPSEYQDKVPNDCRLLIGSHYCILGESFQHFARQTQQRRSALTSISTLLINLGGSDKQNLTSDIVKALESSSLNDKCQLVVVLGAANPNVASVEQSCRRSRFQYQIHINTTNMAELMFNADAAIGAAGGTAFERCAMGLPSINCCVADNQQQNLNNLAEAGAALTLDLRNGLQASAVDRLLVQLLQKSQDLSAHASRLFDARGAIRITMALPTAPSKRHKHVSLCLASIEDAELLYQWQLDPGTRRFAINPQQPSFPEHIQWLKGVLANDSQYLFIAHSGDESLGSLRLDKQRNGQLVVSIYTSPQHYREGIATAILRLTKQVFTHVTLSATIKPENTVSIQLFSSAGFVQTAPTQWLYTPEKRR